MAQAIAVVDRRLWLACAPPLTRLPEVGTLAFYFPRGHAAQCDCDDGVAPMGQIAAEKLLCLVGAVELLVRGDEVFSRIRLLPAPKQTGSDDRIPAENVRGDEGELCVDEVLGAKHEVDDVDKVRGLRADEVLDGFVRRDVDKVHEVDDVRREGEIRVDDEYPSRHADGHGLVRVDKHKLPVEDVDHAKVPSGDLHAEDVLGDSSIRREAKPVVVLVRRAARDPIEGEGELVRSGTSPKDNARRDEDPSCDADGHGLVRVDKNYSRDEDHTNLKDSVRRASSVQGNARCDTLAPDQDIRSGVPVHIPSIVQGAFVQAQASVLDNLQASAELLAAVDTTAKANGEQAANADTGVVANADVLLVFPKVLTASQVVRSGRGTLNIPLNCANEIFPPLPAVVEKGHPKQSLVMADLRGQRFGFNHTLCGEPGKRQRHMLTTGWNKFLEKKTPAEGDVLLFIRYGHELRVALQRTAMPEALVQAQEIADAARMAKEGAAFTVTWCPRRGEEFVVPRAEVDQALAMEWKVGMRVSCRTGVVQPGVIHEHLPYETVSKQGTVKIVRDQDWQKLHVHWDDDRTGSATHCFRLFGVDICPLI